MEIACPVPKKAKITVTDITSKIRECVAKRAERKESQMKDVFCPSGDFTYEDGLPINSGTLAHHMAVAMLFDEIDRDALRYMCDLRELREKDPIKWTEDLRKKTESSTASGVESEANNFAQRYLDVCVFSHIQGLLNSDPSGTKWITNTDTYPQTTCNRIAAQKAQAWYNMGIILMNESISKSWQNDKDTFMSSVKNRYSNVRDKVMRYKEIATKAFQSVTGLPRTSIKN